MDLIVKAIIWLWKRKTGRAFLLSVITYFALSVAWQYTEVGTVPFNIIAAVIGPGFRIGGLLARFFLPNNGRHWAQEYLCVLAAEFALLTVPWYLILRVMDNFRTVDSSAYSSDVNSEIK